MNSPLILFVVCTISWPGSERLTLLIDNLIIFLNFTVIEIVCKSRMRLNYHQHVRLCCHLQWPIFYLCRCSVPCQFGAAGKSIRPLHRLATDFQAHCYCFVYPPFHEVRWPSFAVRSAKTLRSF